MKEVGMGILDFPSRSKSPAGEPDGGLATILRGFSIEVMPRTAAKVPSFPDLLPAGTRIYIANIDGTPLDDLVATAKRLRADGFEVMPHFPARSIESRAVLEEQLRRYRDEAGVDQALVLAGGLPEPRGEFENSMRLLDTGLFEKYGFRRLHVAGHPEGSRDIDGDGSTRNVDAALRWKQDYARRTGTNMAIITQFMFDARPAIEWSERIRVAGISLPIHLGVAGPTKLQTLIKFALACGVGPSIQVLRKRAMDLTKLMVPYTPAEVLSGVANHLATHPERLIEKVHVFPLGGIVAAADWVRDQRLEATDSPARSA
jgi:methylenetetrahydrofolate reductase (NADPH)